MNFGSSGELDMFASLTANYIPIIGGRKGGAMWLKPHLISKCSIGFQFYHRNIFIQ